MKKLLILFFLLGFSFISLAQKAEKYTISGYVKDKSTGEGLIGASVYLPDAKLGTTTNTYGFYSMTLKKGEYKILYSYLGYGDITKTVNLNKDIKLTTELQPSAQMLEAVDITAERKDANIKKVEMSVNKIPMRTIKKMPAFLGEVDVLKTIQLLPGVISGGDGSTGFHVRGGSADQNLVLLDGAPVYNASHFVGFFSVFNSDAIKEFKLYKGGIPAEFGGRLASVLDIHMNEGNLRKYSVSGGIGVLSSRLTVEGPIIKDKCSFLITGRRTYFDIFTAFAADTLVQDMKIFFYDLNAKVNYKINDNNRIFLSGYFGKDVLEMQDMMGMRYGNGTGTLRWNHLFSDKLFMNAMVLYSKYNYNVSFDQDLTMMDWKSSIEDIGIKGDLTYYLTPKNTIKFGIKSTHHIFDPGRIYYKMDSMETNYDIQNNHAYEHGIFIQNEQKITALLSATYGVRFSAFQNIGPKDQYYFDTSNPQEYVINDTSTFARNEIFNTYSGFEPRIGLRYTLTENSSVKASYNRTIQYLHLATNTSSATPVDYWFPCSPNIKPQLADQVALGYFRNFKEDMFETSVEVYYKKMDNVIDFRDHAEMLLNEAYEGEIRTGEAYSYGLELYLKKSEGKFNGWISYTYSETKRRIPEINDGRWYFAPYDQTHDVSVVMNYDVTPALTVSMAWVYSTPKPRTFPTGKYEYQHTTIPVYSDRNDVRIIPYHRMDVSATYNFMKTKKGEKFIKESSISIGAFNVYNKKNPMSITFKQSKEDPDVTVAEVMYLPIVPSITYNFKF